MPSFDGENLVITLDSGVTSVEIQDVYEAWKDWMLASALNRKYPQAFRSDGGAPLSAIINQGSYFFLNNTAGWRMRPPEEDITIYITGNLAVEDTTLPAFVPTVGAYTAAILGLQPVTQGVDEQLGRMLQALWTLQGLDPNNPLTVTPSSRDAGDVSQTITGDPATSVTVTTT